MSVTPRHNRRGFTVIETLIAVTVIITISAFIVPKTLLLREATYTDAASVDLRNLVIAQELLYDRESRYATDANDAGLNYAASDKINVVVQYVLADNSWLATAEHLGMPDAQCAVALGEFIPPGYVGSRVECVKLFR